MYRLAACLLVATIVLSGCGRPPQIGASPEAFRTVDALWTAVTSQRTDLLEQTAAELKSLHAAQKLSDAAYESLQEIIAQARAGQWRPAAVDLKQFIQGQRRLRASR